MFANEQSHVCIVYMGYMLAFMQSAECISTLSMWSKRSLWSTHSSIATAWRMNMPDEVTSHACMPICLELYIHCTIASMINNLYTWKSIDLEYDNILLIGSKVKYLKKLTKKNSFISYLLKWCLIPIDNKCMMSIDDIHHQENHP